ncbi:MAG: SGNH/GDSL hydrolase family protein [Ignavibacteriales bacterium]|nr:SGNH/GDSL hydrolase family protein [Ignavibacteriales bacterium]
MNRNKLTTEKIASELKISQKIIKDFLASNKSSKYPKWFYAVPVLIPIVFLIILETSLQIFNYGNTYNQWVQITNDKIMLNPQIAYRYFFSTKGIPYSNQNVFDKVKKTNAFRVFILGESSAAGYPFLPNGSFAVYIKKRLELLYPDNTIEIINLSMSAINSYALKDMLPGVLEQKPDLILIYTGHNEYYGALGVGSMESLGTSREIINFVLWLNKFKSVELLRNAIKSVANLFSSPKETTEGGTLMARMAKDQMIPLHSSLFEKGIKQFENNLNDIFNITHKASVPVIIGTLAYNLKDQEPFISTTEGNLPAAKNIFEKAKSELKMGNRKQADSLFRYAKDLDALRFRAPEKINQIINQLALTYNYPVVDVDKYFNSISPDGIVGNNLMTDHLHPTLSGYQILGRLFFEKMKEINLLPKGEPVNLQDKTQDSIVLHQYHFSQLDSTIGNFRIAYLKNDWPFVNKNQIKSPNEIIKLHTYVDTVAIKVVDGKIPWERAHRDIAQYYLKNKNYSLFAEEVRVLTDQYPFINEYYDFALNQLLMFRQYELAYNFLIEYNKIEQTAFTTKWLGIISLSRDKTENALQYLKTSLGFNGQDTQVLYNLAGVYVLRKEYNLALNIINQCLEIDPNFPGAKKLQMQLNSIKRN